MDIANIDIANIINAVGVIIIGVFSFLQYWFNKRADHEFKVKEKEVERLSYRRADNSASIYRELHNLLHNLHADRVYIVQPHPLGNEDSISIYFEVTRKGVVEMKSQIQKLPIKSLAVMTGDLANTLFWAINNVDECVKDKYAKSLFLNNGTEKAYIKRLSDNRHDWVGSLFVEFTHSADTNEDEVRNEMHLTATNIQYILPEIRI
jgi:hypothetical protein